MDIEPWVPVFYEQAGFGVDQIINIGVGVGGALLGALVGGYISWKIAKADRDAARQNDAEAATAVKKAQLVRAQFQVSLILSDAEATVVAINESLELANRNGMTAQPLFMRMMPIIGSMSTPTINLDDISPLIVAKKNDLVHVYIEAHAKHDVLFQAMARFDKEKASLNERVSPFMRNVNGVSMLEMTPDRYATLKPFFDAADSLAASIRKSADEVATLARQATFGIGPVAQEIFSDKDFPILIPKGQKDPD